MYVLCNYLTVKCLFDANELNEALRILNAMDLEVFLQNGSESEFKFFDDTPQNVSLDEWHLINYSLFIYFAIIASAILSITFKRKNFGSHG